ncbi:MAG: extracellular solute-binding protein, partial [Oscillospiraceae bacterium]|nr:extracellular solute-binding protein [Oscillospiraceae bacterium]
MKRITVKTVSSLALAACLLFVFMAGCSPSSSIAPTTNPPSAPTAGTPGAPTATAPAKQDFSGTTITMLRHSGYEADWMAEKFQKLKEETGITVVVEMVNYAQLHDKIVVDAAGGGGTYDIIATTDAWVGEFAGSGWLTDLNPMFNDPTLYDANYNRDDVAASMFEANVVDGALYAIPWKFNNILMVYRSDLIPAPPETWDEYLQVVKDNTKDGVYGVGLSLSTTSIDTFLSLLCTNGGALLSEDNKTCLLDSPEAIETLEFIMELHKYAAP